MRRLIDLWEDFLYVVDEMHKAGFVFPIPGYPFISWVEPERFDIKLEDESSEKK